MEYVQKADEEYSDESANHSQDSLSSLDEEAERNTLAIKENRSSLIAQNDATGDKISTKKLAKTRFKVMFNVTGNLFEKIGFLSNSPF